MQKLKTIFLELLIGVIIDEWGVFLKILLIGVDYRRYVGDEYLAEGE